MCVRSKLAGVMLSVFAYASGLRAQDVQRGQLEARIETLISRTTAIHAGIGANIIGGEYLRLGFLGAAGARHVGNEWRQSGRLDLMGRFHVDPLREFKYEVYVVGGATALFDEGVRTRVRAFVGAGIEGPALGSGWILGAEGGFGGGGRVALTIKRARNGAR